MKICLMRQGNIKQSENRNKLGKDVVQTMPDLIKPFSDFIDGSRAFGDDFALEDTERNDYALDKSEKVSDCFAVKRDILSHVLNTGEVVLDGSAPTTVCKEKNDDFVTDEISDSNEELSEQTSLVSNCTTLERNSLLSLDLSCVIKYDPYESAHSYAQNNDETFTKSSLMQLGDHKVAENGNELDQTLKDIPTARASPNTEPETNKKKRGRTSENPSISKVARKRVQMKTSHFGGKSSKEFRVCHRRTYASERSYECDVYSKRLKGNSALKNIRINTDERLYDRGICSKLFKQESILKAHIRIHTGEKPYKCDVCSKQFAHVSNFKRHSRIHTGERPYQCNICSKRFLRGDSLKSHIRIHTGERPYECNVCSKRFAGSSALKSHIRIHTGERPYECNVCSKRFADSSALKSHIRIHTGERPYKCKKCSKRFEHNLSLKRHVRIHTGEKPYKCDKCSKQFTRVSNFERHIKIHTGERPYQCIMCSKRFIRGDSLKIHIRIHTGERPYICEICSKRFQRNSTLKQHIRIHKEKDLTNMMCVQTNSNYIKPENNSLESIQV